MFEYLGSDIANADCGHIADMKMKSENIMFGPWSKGF